MFPFGLLLTENIFTFCNGYETKHLFVQYCLPGAEEDFHKATEEL